MMTTAAVAAVTRAARATLFTGGTPRFDVPNTFGVRRTVHFTCYVDGRC
jgi:hypothetical protein